MNIKHLKSKYFKIYNQIIDNRLKNPLPEDEYGEIHHIIPRSLGGSNDDSNLVKLSAREHYICHYLLTKFTENEQYFKMVKAFDAMGMRGKGQEQRNFLNSRLFQLNRIKAAKAHSIMMTGRKQDPEIVKRRAKSNTGKKRSKESIENYKKSTVFKKYKFTGLKNHKCYPIDIYDSEGNLIDTSYEPFIEFCKRKGYPIVLKKSYQNNGQPIYTSSKSHPSKENMKFKGWFAIKRTYK